MFKVYRSRDIFVYVMYYIHVTSVPSLLIESTDSMIQGHACIYTKKKKTQDYKFETFGLKNSLSIIKNHDSPKLKRFLRQEILLYWQLLPLLKRVPDPFRLQTLSRTAFWDLQKMDLGSQVTIQWMDLAYALRSKPSLLSTVRNQLRTQ